MDEPTSALGLALSRPFPLFHSGHRRSIRVSPIFCRSRGAAKVPAQYVFSHLESFFRHLGALRQHQAVSLYHVLSLVLRASPILVLC